MSKAIELLEEARTCCLRLNAISICSKISCHNGDIFEISDRIRKAIAELEKGEGDKKEMVSEKISTKEICNRCHDEFPHHCMTEGLCPLCTEITQLQAENERLKIAILYCIDTAGAENNKYVMACRIMNLAGKIKKEQALIAKGGG